MTHAATGDISTCLWFDGRAEEAARFYVSVFPDGRIGRIGRFGAQGAVVTAGFELRGRPFLALNGGPAHRFTPAVSLVVDCGDQAEIDHFWERLTDGGAEGRCGWLTDRFGVSWQVVPRALPDLISRGPGVMQVFTTMSKLDIAALAGAGS